ncbi:hypothetical protein NYE25_28110 [Paenibacillus sp. FSL E2-8871]|uniref:hypothetical protein n=1 Tax=unclassified Paenibacillus TaxID=185978 RepID=UPI0030FA80D6
MKDENLSGQQPLPLCSSEYSASTIWRGIGLKYETVTQFASEDEQSLWIRYIVSIIN